MFGLNWMKFSFTYKVDNVWNSLKYKLREKNLFKFTTTIKEGNFKRYVFKYLTILVTLLLITVTKERYFSRSLVICSCS